MTITEGDYQIEVDGSTLCSFNPIISADLQSPFVYESHTPIRKLGTTFEGWIDFEYISGPQKGEIFRVPILPFKLEIEVGTTLVDTPFF